MSRHLTAEEKQAAVAAYLAGKARCLISAKIRHPQYPKPAKMVETVQAGGTLRGYHGASRHKGTAYTTAADREKDRAGMPAKRLRLRRSCVTI